MVIVTHVGPIVLFKKAIVGLIEEYSSSCLCLERLHQIKVGLVLGPARVTDIFFRFRRKMNPKKALTGARQSLFVSKF